MRIVLCLLVFGAVVSCKKTEAPADVRPSKPLALTFLITGAENGYLLPTPDGASTRGGAAEVLGRWLTVEGHCVGPCSDARTIALSTGDNANGQSISSYFKGQSTAEVMQRMGYSASAFGNRELDWKREQFLANAKTGGFPYLAANLIAKDEAGAQLGLQPFVVVRRGGVKVAVVGLAARKATKTPMPGRMTGLELISDEAALDQAIPAARESGADVVTLVTDGCLHDWPELLERHPEWALAFVAGRDCERDYPGVVGGTRLVYPGRHWNGYARVRLTVDLSKPQAERVTEVETATVEVSGRPDPKTAELIGSWKGKVNEALGEQIGFSATGLEQESAQMSAWLTTSLKERFKTDVALLNRKGVRQSLPAGAITSATIWDLVPFENEIVTVKLTGAQLLAAAQNTEARFAGLTTKGDGFADAKGAPIDPQRVYTLATTDYLYLGGDGFALHEADRAPLQTGVSWQRAVIEWTHLKVSSEARPLESLLK